jgi:hypothetical protein
VTPTDIEAVRAGLASATFVDGKTTAGWSAKLVKSNLQASDSSDLEVRARLSSASARINHIGTPLEGSGETAECRFPIGRLRTDAVSTCGGDAILMV